MYAVDIIGQKRDGGELSPAAFAAFIDGAVSGRWTPAQVAALLMAIRLRGMSAGETTDLTGAMLASGVRVDLAALPGPKVGKHSTGGVGDKVSLVLAPLVAACGVTVPKMSGRGLGHTGGTLDKLESIPGFQTALSLDAFRMALAEHGCAIISQTSRIAPADRVLYALRDETGTIDSVPLITASILSKKLAEGSQALVLDVKCGRGAFMKTPAQARVLARSLVDVGCAHGVETEAVITRMDDPLGRAVGNALEVREALDLLRGEGPASLRLLTVTLAARMLVAARVVPDEAAGIEHADRALRSGAALERFRRLVAGQGGRLGLDDDASTLPVAEVETAVCAPRSGVVAGIDAEQIGRAALLLGAGRLARGAALDPAAGVVLGVERGDRVVPGQTLAVLYHAAAMPSADAERLVHAAVELGDTAPSVEPWIMERITR
ncbi:MAG: thymidine phosphorylase [Acidobacteria bacterium]|nr:thymidine phosphorylase [Acidobacteriota bacterium]